MSNEFWVGLLASIPVGIVTSLVTLPIQRWLERLHRSRDRSKQTRQRSEMAAVLYFRKHPEVFTQYMAQLLLRVVLFGIVLGGGYLAILATRGLPAPAAGFDLPEWVPRLEPTPVMVERFGQLTVTFGSIAVFTSVLPIFRMWRLYRDPQYFESGPHDLIMSLEAMETRDLIKEAKTVMPYL